MRNERRLCQRLRHIPTTNLKHGDAIQNCALGLFEPGGNGNELETSCTQQLSATSCSTPGPVGGGLMGYVGYSWNPVGIEGFLAGEMGQHSSLLIELYAEEATGEFLNHRSCNFNTIFFAHCPRVF